MSNFNSEGVLMDKWFKTPNAVIDTLAGDVLSPTACVMLMTIIRYTWGSGNRKNASIPHKVFMQKTGIKRAETLGKYVDELEDSGIVIVDKANGRTTKYSINKASKHFLNVPSLDDETSTDKPVRNISSGTDNTDTPLLNNRTTTTTDNPYSNKDITNKEIINKDINQEKKKESPKPSKQKRKRKHDFVEFEFTDNQKSKCSEYGININSLLSEFRDYHEARGNQFVDWSKAFNTWINNHIKFNKLNPVSNGGNYANSQPNNNSSNRETQEQFEQRLQREFNEQFREQV